MTSGEAPADARQGAAGSAGRWREDRHTNSPLETSIGFHAALRRVIQRAPRLRPLASAGSPLERQAGDSERPQIKDARPIEDATFRARPVPGGPDVGFAAFLDGSQESHVVAWEGAAPVVLGRVAAVVRARTERRLATWRPPLAERALYLPFAYASWTAFEDVFPRAGLVDTSRPAANGEVPAPHPTLLLERARQHVQHDRERLERALAERWCAEERRPLYIDGSICGSDVIAGASCAAGIIKNHRTLYASGEGVDAVLALRRSERSSAFLVRHRDHRPVLSWYLRLRDPVGRDAFWGLVRVEVALSDDVTARADQVSRWVLSESAPLAAPDSRWDRMAYGIRDCEEFLRAIR